MFAVMVALTEFRFPSDVFKESWSISLSAGMPGTASAAHDVRRTTSSAACVLGRSRQRSKLRIHNHPTAETKEETETNGKRADLPKSVTKAYVLYAKERPAGHASQGLPWRDSEGNFILYLRDLTEAGPSPLITLREAFWTPLAPIGQCTWKLPSDTSEPPPETAFQVLRPKPFPVKFYGEIDIVHAYDHCILRTVKQAAKLIDLPIAFVRRGNPRLLQPAKSLADHVWGFVRGDNRVELVGPGQFKTDYARPLYPGYGLLDNYDPDEAGTSSDPGRVNTQMQQTIGDIWKEQAFGSVEAPIGVAFLCTAKGAVVHPSRG
ncbi:hypothetical protein WJX72_009072 [[Myrmecia] bisecta]|uniref:Uncharacterized protein n=1 Tax=[Myrmecia] bisecta TaxID=41462 RepID=A0AAW1P0X2_9CHLO